MRIEQIMRHDPTKVTPETPVSQLIEWYANPGNRSRYTYVVDKKGMFKGVVTMMEILDLFLPKDLVDGYEKSELSEPEVMLRVSAALAEGKDIPVSRIMRKDLPTVAASGFFLDARLLLRERQITALPVVDGRGELVGEITRRVILRLLDIMLRDPEMLALKQDSKHLFDTTSEFFIG